MTNVEVRYLGNKKIKRDTVTRSLAIWPGNNSVAQVPEAVALRLCQYPDVWQMANKPVIDRPAPVKKEPGKAPELHDIKQVESNSGEDDPDPVTAEEVGEILESLDQGEDFTNEGLPRVASIRALFEGREVSTDVIKEAWKTFQGE